jgi:hypothetical protein
MTFNLVQVIPLTRKEPEFFCFVCSDFGKGFGNGLKSPRIFSGMGELELSQQQLSLPDCENRGPARTLRFAFAKI